MSQHPLLHLLKIGNKQQLLQNLKAGLFIYLSATKKHGSIKSNTKQCVFILTLLM